MTDELLSICELKIGYNHKVVVPSFSLKVSSGEFVTILGPSGCGKSTVLRAVAGFIYPMAGTISLSGRDITNSPPQQRDVGIVFQNYALFPTMTAFENIAFGLRVLGRPRSEIRERVRELSETAGITDCLDRKPAELSGGQQQRVAIGRALIMGSQVLLFDEPLSNLDARVRLAMRKEIKRIQGQVGFTAIFVTHDQEEALSLSDRIVVLNEGRTEQIGSARDLYFKPITPFVAAFIGGTNELPASLTTRLLGVSAKRCFVKFEDLLIGQKDGGETAIVTHVEFLGPVTRIDLELDGHPVSALRFGGIVLERGENVRVTIRPGCAHIFDVEDL